MSSQHAIYFENSENLSQLENNSIDLVVTSPPYPMIEMWDKIFSDWEPLVSEYLKSEDGFKAFNEMHKKLDLVWNECARVVKDGGFICINIGDATRKIGDNFKLYSNHARIVSFFQEMNFDSLPLILWRKQTNAPNKFMGSGMLPSGAYVTLEHEYVLIFRKGNKKKFSSNERIIRQESAFFWEERNIWFSGIWDFKGVKQKLTLNESRERSAAFPLELANRLVNMYSMKGDTVLDPFVGTGTTVNACILNNRNSVGYEVDETFKDPIYKNIKKFFSEANIIIYERYQNHNKFIKEYIERKGPTKYINENHDFPVVTQQELRMKLEKLTKLKINDNRVLCEYEKFEPSHDMKPIVLNDIAKKVSL